MIRKAFSNLTPVPWNENQTSPIKITFTVSVVCTLRERKHVEKHGKKARRVRDVNAYRWMFGRIKWIRKT